MFWHPVQLVWSGHWTDSERLASRTAASEARWTVRGEFKEQLVDRQRVSASSTFFRRGFHAHSWTWATRRYDAAKKSDTVDLEGEWVVGNWFPPHWGFCVVAVWSCYACKELRSLANDALSLHQCKIIAAVVCSGTVMFLQQKWRCICWVSVYKQLFVNVSFVYICKYMSMYLWSLVSCQAAFISGLQSRAVEEEEEGGGVGVGVMQMLSSIHVWSHKLFLWLREANEKTVA